MKRGEMPVETMVKSWSIPLYKWRFIVVVVAKITGTSTVVEFSIFTCSVTGGWTDHGANGAGDVVIFEPNLGMG